MKFHLYRDKAKAWRWRLKAANGRTIANSGEGYRRRKGALDAILMIQAYAAATPVEGKAK